VLDSPAGSEAMLHGSTVHYLDAGSGPPVVLIHGLLSSHRSWLRLADQLVAERRIVAPDLLGHGASAKPIDDYSLSSHAGPCAICWTISTSRQRL
jgi:pimeloyl-ACP methyl ester carboxylesterase